MKESTVETAMAIIMAAGDARLLCTKALNAIANEDLNTAKELHAQAKKQIGEAHRLQTDAIQGEINGGPPLEYNALFTHAQDTLMTIYSEINMTSHLLKICECYEQRLASTEARLQELERSEQ